jgi:DNA uptake protein ComE-like DNA-binding protein
MKKITQLLLAATMLSIVMVACKESKGEEAPEPTTAEQGTSATAEAPEAEVQTTEAAVVLNANLATEVQLTEIGLSAEMVAGILENRPFLTMNDLDAMVGEETNKEELYTKIFVPFNLNTTAEEDFKMIPGVGDRMAHEFDEYRPYTSIKQFRKEIGKYVDEDEVDRYENYVFVPVELNTASEEDIKALPGVGDRMAHEFEEYRPYTSMEQFRREIGKYVDDKELARLERFVYLNE